MKKNILFLTPWYPNRFDPMDGLFVQKHAHAVSLLNNVCVLYICGHSNVRKFEVIITDYYTVKQVHVYFPYINNSIFRKLIKPVQFLHACSIGFRTVYKMNFKPELVHANVLTRTVLMAYFHKLLTGVPYLITEHWTRLLPGRNGFNGFFRKKIARIAVKNAAYILPVSNELLAGLRENKLLLTKHKIVENVVDDCFYKNYDLIPKNKIQLVNVTCFLDIAKNLKGLLRTVKELSLVRNDFELILIGEGKDYNAIYEYFKSLDFEENIVKFVGLKTSDQVAEIIRNVDFVVQFSNYESAGVVVQEALVSGTPVISSKVGIAPDYINESNGILVEPGNEKQLLEALNYAIDHVNQYENEQIRENSKELFSYKNIGDKFDDIYCEILNSKK